MWCQPRGREADHGGRMESRNGPTAVWSLIFSEGANLPHSKMKSSQQARMSGHPYGKWPLTVTQSTQGKQLDVGKISWAIKALATEEQLNKPNFIMKNRFSTKNPMKKMKRQATDLEEIFALHLFDKEFLQNNNNKDKWSSKNKLKKRLGQILDSKKLCAWKVSPWEDTQQLLSGECKLKPQQGIMTPIRMVTVMKTDNTKCWQGHEHRTLHGASRSIKCPLTRGWIREEWYSHYMV